MEMYIPIKATGKERPRYSTWTKSMYTPKKTKDFESVIATYCAMCMRDNNVDITDGPVNVTITVYCKVPQSWPKWKKSEALTGIIRPMKTPDGDNILKAILDAMNNVVYVDDKQVVEFSLKKIYDTMDMIKIQINHL